MYQYAKVYSNLVKDKGNFYIWQFPVCIEVYDKRVKQNSPLENLTIKVIFIYDQVPMFET